GGIALRAYAALVESRYHVQPDPLEPVPCEDLLSGVPRLMRPAVSSGETMVAALATTPVDVIIDFGSEPARELATYPRHGIWRYHFGDRRRYPLGSGFLREIIDGISLTGIELVRLGRTAADDLTVLRAMFRTVPFPSRQANRFGPLWGTRHFVIQGLWA